MKSLPTLMAAGLLALFAAGCGDSNDTKSDTSGSSGARGYAETGQAVSDICQRVDAETKPLSSQLSGVAKHDAPLLEQLVAISDKYIKEMQAIKPDPKLQDAFDAYVNAVEVSQSKAGEVVKVAKSGDDEAYRMAAEALNAEDQATHPLARALGATECAKQS